MTIDPFLITTGAAGVLAIVGWAKVAARKAELEFAKDDISDLALRNVGLANRNLDLASRVTDLESDAAKIQQQRVDASRKAAETATQRAADRRQAAEAQTKTDLGTTKLRPRDDVVAPVREKRAAQKSGAGRVAAKQGG